MWYIFVCMWCRCDVDTTPLLVPPSLFCPAIFCCVSGWTAFCIKAAAVQCHAHLVCAESFLLACTLYIIDICVCFYAKVICKRHRWDSKVDEFFFVWLSLQLHAHSKLYQISVCGKVKSEVFCLFLFSLFFSNKSETRWLPVSGSGGAHKRQERILSRPVQNGAHVHGRPLFPLFLICCVFWSCGFSAGSHLIDFWWINIKVCSVNYAHRTFPFVCYVHRQYIVVNAWPEHM